MHARRPPLAFAAVAIGALTALGGAACLPADTRPAPGSLRLSVIPGDPAVIETADGWSIEVDELLVGIGRAGFEFQCDVYADARYDRLLDARRPGEQKVSQLFGLGQCYFGFSLSWPSPEALLGEGVTTEDFERMAPKWIDGGPPTGPTIGKAPGIPIEIALRATRAGTTKRIHWALRQGAGFTRCGVVDGEETKRFEFKSDETLEMRLAARGAALFQDGADPATAALRFDPMAFADHDLGDNDGNVTLDELAGVTLAMARQFGPYRTTLETPLHTLEEYVYLELVPRLLQPPAGLGCRTTTGRL
jgi:hypothetical protein